MRASFSVLMALCVVCALVAGGRVEARSMQVKLEEPPAAFEKDVHRADAERRWRERRARSLAYRLDDFGFEDYLFGRVVAHRMTSGGGSFNQGEYFSARAGAMEVIPFEDADVNLRKWSLGWSQLAAGPVRRRVFGVGVEWSTQGNLFGESPSLEWDRFPWRFSTVYEQYIGLEVGWVQTEGMSATPKFDGVRLAGSFGWHLLFFGARFEYAVEVGERSVHEQAFVWTLGRSALPFSLEIGWRRLDGPGFSSRWATAGVMIYF